MSGFLIPKRLQIETIFGCNAKCIMCAVSLPATRLKGIMSIELFKHIIDFMKPYNEQIEKVDLFGLGEPLLDPHIIERIRYAKEKGFQNLAISTNADLLDVHKQNALLETGIETVIFSIDGVNKETHENIRRGVVFERVIENCESIIRMRNEHNYKTRFVIRFIRQNSNKTEWEQFLAYWNPKISPGRNDLLIAYDVNTMGGEVISKQELLGDGPLDESIEALPCHQVFDRLIILNNGIVPLCCEDTPHAKYMMGDVKETLPIDIFNGTNFQRMRRLHTDHKKTTLTICRECTLLYSENKMQRYTA